MEGRCDQLRLAQLVVALPEVVLDNILRFLKGTDTLPSLSVCSKFWRRLTLRAMFNTLHFHSFVLEAVPEAYTSHGRQCRHIELSFSRLPLVDDLADAQRSLVYARVIKASSGYLHSLSIDTAGSKLENIKEALLALSGAILFPQFKRLSLKCFDDSESGLAVVDKFFEGLVANETLPRLEDLHIEASWTLSSTRAAMSMSALSHFTDCLKNLPSLRRLSLNGLRAEAADLKPLLADVPRLQQLSLLNLPGLELRDYFQSLAGSRCRSTLEGLTLGVRSERFRSNAMSLPQPTTDHLSFPRLLHLGLQLYEASLAPIEVDLGPTIFFKSFFECPWLKFPVVANLSLTNAFNHSRATSLTLGEALCTSIPRMFPTLRTVLGSFMQPHESDSSIEENLAKLGVYFPLTSWDKVKGIGSVI